MKLDKKGIVYNRSPLAREAILDILTKNDTSHFVKLSDLVDLADYSTKLSINATHFNIYDENKLVGFSGCYFNDNKSKIGYISGIILLDGYRRFGLGSDLLHSIFDYGRDMGFREVRISPDLKNFILIGFLEKNGFVLIETIQGRGLFTHELESGRQHATKVISA